MTGTQPARFNGSQMDGHAYQRSVGPVATSTSPHRTRRHLLNNLGCRHSPKRPRGTPETSIAHPVRTPTRTTRRYKGIRGPFAIPA